VRIRFYFQNHPAIPNRGDKLGNFTLKSLAEVKTNFNGDEQSP